MAGSGGRDGGPGCSCRVLAVEPRLELPEVWEAAQDALEMKTWVFLGSLQWVWEAQDRFWNGERGGRRDAPMCPAGRCSNPEAVRHEEAAGALLLQYLMLFRQQSLHCCAAGGAGEGPHPKGPQAAGVTEAAVAGCPPDCWDCCYVL